MRPVLVGRGAELSVLDDAVTRLAAGSGAYVHVTGEAGIGKTSLLDVVADRVRARGIELRYGSADETDRLRRLALVRTLLPELDRSDETDPAARAVAAAEHVAVHRPISLLADDVHWADDASLDAMGAIARRAATLGILLITAARAHPAPDRLRRLDELSQRQGSHRLALGLLDRRDLASLVEARVGMPPGPRLTELLAGTAGNPFLAVELVTGLVDDDQLHHDDTGYVDVEAATAMSPDLAVRLAGRTLLAVPDADLVLRAAAVLPSGFTTEELAAVLDRPLTALLTTALAAVEAGVFVDTGSLLTFRHDLLRRAVLQQTPTSIVRTLHRRAAEVLTARGADAERVTACLLAGCDPLDPSDHERLVSYGRVIRERHPAASADLLHLALSAVEPDDLRSLDTTIELGWALIAAGRADEVSPLLSERRPSTRGIPPVNVARLEGVAMSLTGRLDEVAERLDGMTLEHLVVDYDPSDADVVDAAAELAQLRAASGRTAEAHDLLDWIDRSPTPSSPFRITTVSTVRANLASIEGSFREAIEHARTAQITAGAGGIPIAGSAVLFEALCHVPWGTATPRCGCSVKASVAARHRAGCPHCSSSPRRWRSTAAVTGTTRWPRPRPGCSPPTRSRSASVCSGRMPSRRSSPRHGASSPPPNDGWSAAVS